MDTLNDALFGYPLIKPRVHGGSSNVKRKPLKDYLQGVY